MKHIISALVFTLSVLSSFAKTDFENKTFTFCEFSTLCNNAFFDIKCVYNPQKAGAVDVLATELGFKYLDIKHSDNTLNLGVKRNSINNLSREFGKVTVYYSYVLENVAVNGSGDVSMSNISATEVNANVNGSGEIELKGSTSNASYLVIGSGEVEAHRLITKSVTAGVTGSGEITYNRGAKQSPQ